MPEKNTVHMNEIKNSKQKHTCFKMYIFGESIRSEGISCNT